MTIEWKEEWVDVGFVKSRDDFRKTSKVCLEAEDGDEYVTWTDEFLESTEDFQILKDMMGKERVYKKTCTEPICADCETVAFYDEKSEDFYCPICNS